MEVSPVEPQLSMQSERHSNGFPVDLVDSLAVSMSGQNSAIKQALQSCTLAPAFGRNNLRFL